MNKVWVVRMFLEGKLTFNIKLFHQFDDVKYYVESFRSIYPSWGEWQDVGLNTHVVEANNSEASATFVVEHVRVE